MKKRVLSVLLCLAMAVGMLPTMALAGESDTETVFPYTYATENDETAEKVSHPQVAPNSKYEGSRRNDGIVDYIGNGMIAANGGYGDDSGCRGQSYSWSAMAYGDWVYTGLNYNALGQTVQLMDVGLGHKYDPELLPGILNVLYNGDFFTAERDNSANVPGGALVKLNVKTGETKILMSSSSEGDAKHVVNLRNALKYNDKFYFCGTVDHAPQIWQVDPTTDECKMVYGMSVKDFGEGFRDGISAGIRGMCVYKDELIVSCVTKKANGEFEAQIYSTKTPDDPESFKVIATQAQLFNYPAFHFSDSIYGGSIWEIVEFNNKLYVSICTGTPDNMPDENTMQSFAIVCGEKDDRTGKWTWTPVVGNKNDGAKYTFGIDPERTCSGAGVLMVYNDHLYIGEYNDEEISLIQIMFNLDFGFMNKNLEQSVNLYRMDEDENIELVVGDKTDMFPEGGISGIVSGFGHNENQYIWRMTVHNGKLYCGTFDTSSLLEPVGQFSNGDLALWEPVQWNRLFNYIRELLKLTQDKFGVMPLEQMSKEEQIREDIRELFAFFDSTSLAAISDDDTVLPGAGIDAEYDLLADLFGSLPASCFEDGTHADAAMIEALSETFAEDDDAAFYDRIDNDLNGADDVLDDMGVYPDYVDDLESNLEAMQKLAASMKELIQLVKKIVVTAQYMSVAERGCDVYVTEDGVNFETITIDGFGDPFNHGLRVFAETDSGLGFGTANPFYGTQWWLIREDNKPEKPDPEKPTEYTVTFDGNGGEPSQSTMTTTNQKLAKLPKADRGGKYEFDGWYTEKTGGDEITTETVFKSDTTVYAHWTKVSSGSSGGSGSHSSSTYPIIVEDAKNGEVTSSHKYASAGTTVTLTVDPAAGYTLGNLTAYTSNKVDLKLTDKGEGKYTFTMPASKVFVASVFNPVNGRFVDVPSGSYFEEAVNWAVANGITTGTSATTFDPDGICTRAQAVTFLWRATGSPAHKSTVMHFVDVPADSYYYDAVLWAMELGITKGTSDTAFSPNATCSRAQIVTFLWRANGSPAVGGSVTFSDVAADAYYVTAVIWAEKNGITGGIGGGLFGSNNHCTRAQIVTFLYRTTK